MKLVVLIFCKYSQAGKCQMSRYCKYLGAALLGSCTLQIQPGADQIIPRHCPFPKRTGDRRSSTIVLMYIIYWWMLYFLGEVKGQTTLAMLSVCLFWYVEIYWDTIYDEVCYIFWVGKGQASIVLPECVSLLPRQAGWLPVAYWRSNNERCHSDKR